MVSGVGPESSVATNCPIGAPGSIGSSKVRSTSCAAARKIWRTSSALNGVESVVAHGRSLGAAIDRLDWERDEVLVLGSSEAGVIERIFLGSNASKIVRHSPVPVVVVP